MQLNAAQTKFVQDLRTMLPLYKDNADPRLKAPSTNLEWNTKKVTGEFNEPLDAATYAQRTQADLELVAAALPSGAAGQAYAARAAGEVASVFGAPAAATGETPTPAPAAQVAPADATSTTTSAPASATSTSAAPATPPVDVKSLLSGKAEHAGEKLAWKTSVVDLLKLLGKDSSQAARHRYAVALGFPESEISNMPSSEFNDWLRGQLMVSLASNGGNLPSNIA